jgi:L-alanine-DL-glutamate epimerase-like enolase superfamily enzyme
MLRVDPFEFFASLTIDLVVVALLAFVLFYRRHRDRDMAIAISAINITLWALTGALASYTLSLGVGLYL